MSNVYEALQRARSQGEHSQATARRSMPRKTDAVDDRIKPGPVTTRSEQFKQSMAALFGIIRPLLDSRSGSILHVVAATDQEGTSTIARELALLVATSGHRRTGLIDANQLNFATARWFGCPCSRGLISQVPGQTDGAEVLRSVPNTLLSVGCLVDDTGLAAIETGVLRALYEKLRNRFEVTIIDCPPIAHGSYYELLPEVADGIILVVRAEKARRAAVAAATGLVQQAGGHVIGAVLNMRNKYIPSALYRTL